MADEKKKTASLADLAPISSKKTGSKKKTASKKKPTSKKTSAKKKVTAKKSTTKKKVSAPKNVTTAKKVTPATATTIPEKTTPPVDPEPISTTNSHTKTTKPNQGNTMSANAKSETIPFWIQVTLWIGAMIVLIYLFSLLEDPTNKNMTDSNESTKVIEESKNIATNPVEAAESMSDTPENKAINDSNSSSVNNNKTENNDSKTSKAPFHHFRPVDMMPQHMPRMPEPRFEPPVEVVVPAPNAPETEQAINQNNNNPYQNNPYHFNPRPFMPPMYSNNNQVPYGYNPPPMPQPYYGHQLYQNNQ